MTILGYIGTIKNNTLEKISYLKNLAILKWNHLSIIKKLGDGKDGETYLCENNKKDLFVVKLLSAYGKKYLPMTKEFIKKNIKSKHLLDLDIQGNSLMVSPYVELTEIKTDPRNFLDCLKQLCDLEIDLLKQGMLYWDFGFERNSNYMLNNDNNIVVIDYGGNSFLFVNEDKLPRIRNSRKNLIFASNNFLQLELLLHIYYYGLGRRESKKLPSLAQTCTTDDLKKYITFVSDSIKDTIYQKISAATQKNDLTTEQGWNNLKEVIKNTLTSEDLDTPQESADIENIKYEGNEIKVRGYQNFNISTTSLTPVKSEHLQLWDTEQKFALVEKALEKITKENEVKSFLDIGSNLGIYVFLAKLKYKIHSCFGIDYNQKYIDTCNNIASKLGIKNCHFEKKSFSEINNKYDCVLAMGIIHHLFHRTEDFGSLKNILHLFSEMTNKYLIIEFPTEKDAKAKKWTTIPGREKKEEYNLKNFLNYCNLHFSKVEKIGTIKKTRITFLLKK